MHMQLHMKLNVVGGLASNDLCCPTSQNSKATNNRLRDQIVVGGLASNDNYKYIGLML